MAPNEYIYTTGRNGKPDPEKSAKLEDLFAAARDGKSIVIHLHGGLVNERSGTETALRLTDGYLAAQARPVFVVWQSGLLETLKHNLDEIVGEDIFQRLLKRVTQFTVGKFRQGPGERAAGAVPLPKDREVDIELATRTAGGEPYAAEAAPTDLAGVSPAEEQQLQASLEEDPVLIADLTAILAAGHPEREVKDEGARGATVRRVASSASLMDPDVLHPIDEQGRAEGERGILTTIGLAVKAVHVLKRVIDRFRADNDHGVYCTVVEELLREFYLANAGGAVWAAMKKETQDTFAPDADRFGRTLLDGLSEALATGARPRITLVGHSTGAVYINHLLGEVARGRAQGDRAWPRDARFQVVFLAPACTYENFAAVLDKDEDLISDLRMFTMDRATEEKDRLVGPLYPRSLLHLISGALERDPQGASAWTPVVGMARYREPAYADGEFKDVPGLAAGREFLTDSRVVLSPTADGASPGRASGATSHTTFDEDPQVLDSIAAILRGTP
ncbi:hypothetical protein [Streptomyces sp. NPDC047525]|uniref:hypothetical protein n=1 Tax=Streptomyces sp. NPDC047525 TaxID=3155264 RepID=UPI0033F78E77